jgi:hypothetical protein
MHTPRYMNIVYILTHLYFFCTDTFIFQAWSNIVYQLIPNVQQLESMLANFANIIDADEVLLFERATFLVSIFINFIYHYLLYIYIYTLKKV